MKNKLCFFASFSDTIHKSPQCLETEKERTEIGSLFSYYIVSFSDGIGLVDELGAALQASGAAAVGLVFLGVVLHRLQAIHDVAQVAVGEAGQLLDAFLVELGHAFGQILGAVQQFADAADELVGAVCQVAGAVGQRRC